MSGAAPMACDFPHRCAGFPSAWAAFSLKLVTGRWPSPGTRDFISLFPQSKVPQEYGVVSSTIISFLQDLGTTLLLSYLAAQSRWI